MTNENKSTWRAKPVGLCNSLCSSKLVGPSGRIDRVSLVLVRVNYSPAVPQSLRPATLRIRPQNTEENSASLMEGILPQTVLLRAGLAFALDC